MSMILAKWNNISPRFPRNFGEISVTKPPFWAPRSGEVAMATQGVRARNPSGDRPKEAAAVTAAKATHGFKVAMVNPNGKEGVTPG